MLFKKNLRKEGECVKLISVFESIPFIRKVHLPLLETISCTKKEEIAKCIKKISYPSLLKVQSKEIEGKKEKNLFVVVQNNEELVAQISIIKETIKKKFSKIKKFSILAQRLGLGEQAKFVVKKHVSFGFVLEIYYKDVIMHTILPFSDEIYSEIISFLDAEKSSEKVILFLKACQELASEKVVISFSLSVFVSSMEIFQGEVMSI